MNSRAYRVLAVALVGAFAAATGTLIAAIAVIASPTTSVTMAPRRG